jgi:predicted nucleic-acid-binding protein
MRAVDTNVLVRLITAGNPSQTASCAEFVRPGVWVSVLALAETMWVLSTVYGHSSSSVAAAVEMLLDNRLLTVQDADVVDAALDLFRSRPSLGFSDCLILELARKARHLPLGTLDRSLGKVDGAQKL